MRYSTWHSRFYEFVIPLLGTYALLESLGLPFYFVIITMVLVPISFCESCTIVFEI